MILFWYLSVTRVARVLQVGSISFGGPLADIMQLIFSNALVQGTVSAVFNVSLQALRICHCTDEEQHRIVCSDFFNLCRSFFMGIRIFILQTAFS